jgi:hypothetical protein
MSGNENGNLRPDGFSVSVPLGPIGIGGTYYWNPGSPTAPNLTLTGSLGIGGGGAHLVFLRKGMTSSDGLGYGATANLSTIVPSVTANASIPDENGFPQPWKAKVSSIEAGIGIPGVAGTYTATPRQVANILTKYGFISRAMGPDDQLSPFVRTLQSGAGTIGQNAEPPIRFLSSPCQNPLGGGMTGWRSSVDGADPQNSAQPAPSAQQPGGLLGLLMDHLRNN